MTGLSNAQLARKWFEDVWNVRRDATMHELLHPEMVGQMEGLDVHAAADFVRAREAILDALPDLRVEVEELGTERELEPPLERAVMRIVGESLRNVAQHAHANAAKLRLEYGQNEISVIVEDDGVGFDTEPTIAIAAPASSNACMTSSKLRAPIQRATTSSSWSPWRTRSRAE
jgi:signal transduction histidine kinase